MSNNSALWRSLALVVIEESSSALFAAELRMVVSRNFCRPSSSHAGGRHFTATKMVEDAAAVRTAIRFRNPQSVTHRPHSGALPPLAPAIIFKTYGVEDTRCEIKYPIHDGNSYSAHKFSESKKYPLAGDGYSAIRGS